MLSSELNRLILLKAPKFLASDYAPSSFQALKEQASGSLVVWAGASDKTIYGDSHVNHAFRAWHDSLHLKLNAPFNMQGELMVAIEQARQIGSETLGNLIYAEIVGQAEYNLQTGEFPVNQVDFVLNYLKRLQK